MAKSSIGKIVSRVGASGGGKTYAKARPSNYYAVLTLIVVLGLSAVVYSRYERQNPAKASTVYPAVGTTGFASFASEQCGVILSGLNPQRNNTAYSIQKNNVIQIAPRVAAQAGNNATVARFASAIPGLSLDATKMTTPGPLGAVGATYTAGTKCAAGTKYAGQVAYPTLAYWKSVAQKKPTLTTNLASAKFTQYMLVTFAFEPKNVVPKLPSSATISAMFRATASTTTTTTVPTSSTTTTTTPRG